MPHTAHETYVETQVRTATPQRLRLMLIEGAMRFGRQAIECWGDQEHRQQRYTALARCHDILTELYCTIRTDDLAVAGQVKAIYQFLLVQLARVPNQDDPRVLQEVLEVLEEERKTWWQLCEQMPEAPTRDSANQSGGEEITAAGMQAIAPQASASRPGSASKVNRLSLEA